MSIISKYICKWLFFHACVKSKINNTIDIINDKSEKNV